MLYYIYIAQHILNFLTSTIKLLECFLVHSKNVLEGKKVSQQLKNMFCLATMFLIFLLSRWVRGKQYFHNNSFTTIFFSRYKHNVISWKISSVLFSLNSLISTSLKEVKVLLEVHPHDKGYAESLVLNLAATG